MKMFQYIIYEKKVIFFRSWLPIFLIWGLFYVQRLSFTWSLILNIINPWQTEDRNPMRAVLQRIAVTWHVWLQYEWLKACCLTFKYKGRKYTNSQLELLPLMVLYQLPRCRSWHPLKSSTIKNFDVIIFCIFHVNILLSVSLYLHLSLILSISLSFYVFFNSRWPLRNLSFHGNYELVALENRDDGVI